MDLPVCFLFLVFLGFSPFLFQVNSKKSHNSKSTKTLVCLSVF
jgi:hypothetical protein